MKCLLCGNEHEGIKCPLIKAFHYYPDGTVMCTEFVTFADFYKEQGSDLLSLPTHGTRQ